MEYIFISGTIFLVTSAILFVVLFFEIREYKKYKKATSSVISFGAAVNEQIGMIIEHLGRQDENFGDIAKITNLMQQQILFMNTIVQIHTEVLNLTDTLKKAEELHKIYTEGSDVGVEVSGS